VYGQSLGAFLPIPVENLYHCFSSEVNGYEQTLKTWNKRLLSILNRSYPLLVSLTFLLPGGMIAVRVKSVSSMFVLGTAFHGKNGYTMASFPSRRKDLDRQGENEEDCRP